MQDADLQIVLSAFKQRHPDVVDAVKMVAKQQAPGVAPAAAALLQCLLETFDEAEQLKWVMRDMLQAVPRVTEDGARDAYWALKHSATRMVNTLALYGEADRTKATFYNGDPSIPADLANWKSDIP